MQAGHALVVTFILEYDLANWISILPKCSRNPSLLKALLDVYNICLQCALLDVCNIRL